MYPGPLFGEHRHQGFFQTINRVYTRLALQCAFVMLRYPNLQLNILTVHLSSAAAELNLQTNCRPIDELARVQRQLLRFNKLLELEVSMRSLITNNLSLLTNMLELSPLISDTNINLIVLMLRTKITCMRAIRAYNTQMCWFAMHYINNPHFAAEVHQQPALYAGLSPWVALVSPHTSTGALALRLVAAIEGSPSTQANDGNPSPWKRSRR